jgi:AraC-like DNA-binding protein
VTSLAILFIGFSIFSAIVLAFTHFRRENYRDQLVTRAMGLLLLLMLSGLQIVNFSLLYFDLAWVATLGYRMMLFAVAPTFYLYSQPLLHPQKLPSIQQAQFWHAAPIAISPLIPDSIALPLAFLVGACYLLWLARSLSALRLERTRFRLEMFLLGSVFVIAIGVSILGFALTALPEKLFFSLYAISIGMAFLLVQITLGLRPQLSDDVGDAVQAAYATSTLSNIDCDTVLSKLHILMQDDRVYENAELNLPRLADYLSLSTHQLSELMNARLGKSFSRYLREQRIFAAKIMLCKELSASILSVGLSVGFTSQSNFYDAFREIEGMTPGQFRKLNTTNKTSR